jgi:hypothetical protein
MRKLKILVACEESQAVCKEFRALGHEAYSCDILTCSGGHPEWHLQGDVMFYLNSGWDLLIAHPPCDYLANSGVCHLHTDPSRWAKMIEGAKFFRVMLNADIKYIAVENPIIHKYAVDVIGRRQDQVIQPYMFGHPERKATCLWLKNLPKLRPTDNVKHIMDKLPKREAQRIHYCSPGPERKKIRSKTFPGIAKALATQYSEFILNQP